MSETISNSEVSGSPFRGRRGCKIIIAGGGTGGHIFPAIAIANALKKKDSFVPVSPLEYSFAVPIAALENLHNRQRQQLHPA